MQNLCRDSLASYFEFLDDLDTDDEESGFFDLHRSSMYWGLRETFIEDAMKGDPYAFMTAIWRAYNAGRLSSERFIPKTREERDRLRKIEIDQMLAGSAANRERTSKEAADAH